MKSICGKENILKEIPDILYDESRFTLGIPEKVYFPENRSDISEIMRMATIEKTPVTIIGSQTGITGGSVPTDGCIAISFADMRKILRIETNNNNVPVLYCQPGVSIKEIADFLEHPDSYKYTVAGHEHLLGKNWFYPPAPTELTAQLGGTVATNASGARSYKFGPTRKHIESLSMVLANGETITIKRDCEKFKNGICTLKTDQGTKVSIPQMDYHSPSIKNVSGYFSAPDMDLIELFIGSEGTLALFSEIGIHLSPLPVFIGGLSFFTSRKGAFKFADFLRTQNGISTIEYFDTTALDLIKAGKEDISLKLPEFPEKSQTAVYWEYIETNNALSEDILEKWETVLNRCGSSFDSTWSGFEDRETEKLRLFRHAVPELVNFKIAQNKKKCLKIRKISTDSAVPHNSFEKIFYCFLELIINNRLQTVIFGHLGDFHIHFNILPRTEDELERAISVYGNMMEIVISHGGTVSAEHGIGKIKVNYFEKMYSREALKDMEKIKRILDPDSLLNPGNLFGLST